MQLANKSHKNILALNIVLFFYIKVVYFIYRFGNRHSLSFVNQT